MDEWVESKEGEILRVKDDEYVVMCSKEHYFKIKSIGEWCKECEETIKDKSWISKMLDLMKIDYKQNVIYRGREYNYKFRFNGHSFVMLLDDELRKSKFRDYSLGNTNLIVYNLDSEKCLLHGPEQLNVILKSPSKINLLRFNRQKTEQIEETCTLVEYPGPKTVIKRAENIPEDARLAVAYIRVSSDMQVKDGFSLETQEDEIYRRTKMKGYFLRAIIIDKGLTAKDTVRPGINILRDDMKEGETVIVKSVSRFARNLVDSLVIISEFRKSKVSFVTLEHDVDLNSATGRLVFNILSSVAEMEAESISERTRSGKQYLKSQGRLRSKAPFGWSLNPRRGDDDPVHIINEEEQIILKKILSLRKKNKDMSMYAFTKLINSKFPPPRKAKLWRASYIKDVIKRDGKLNLE
jgi:DNA invertase Pin-like site-specific DNA recombinase